MLEAIFVKTTVVTKCFVGSPSAKGRERGKREQLSGSYLSAKSGALYGKVRLLAPAFRATEKEKCK